MTPAVRDVCLWWIGWNTPERRALDIVRRTIEAVFAHPVRMWHDEARPNEAYDARRQQYSSTHILKWVLERVPAREHRMLAVTDVDLFIPILTFVYGEAQLNGAAAVVSTARLSEDSATVTPQLFAARLAKECVHELGHTFGLLHCASARCVMARSVNLIGVDAKAASLCDACQARYRLLRKDHEHV